MELSTYLQSPELLSSLPAMDPARLRDLVTGRTRQWYADSPDERLRIRGNLARFGLDSADERVDRIIDNVALHYFEKFLPLCLGPAKFHAFLSSHVECEDAEGMVREPLASSQGILCAAAHFGAVEFIIPTLSLHGFAPTAALRFKTERFSQTARAHADAFARTGLFAPISFIEVGKPGTHAALDMAAVLRRHGLLMTVFDEKTDYSVAVELLGTGVWGGAGLDKLITFSGAGIAAFTAFMVRLPGGRYRLTLDPIDIGAGDVVAQMYRHLEATVRGQVEQWYFLHEDIPFVSGNEPAAGGKALQ